MRNLVYILLILSYSSLAQKQSGPGGQNSSIDLKGNSNIVRVIQGNNVTVYDLMDEKQRQQFLGYLKTLPGIQSNIEKMIRYDSAILSIVKKATKSTVFNSKTFTTSFEGYIRENEKLKRENSELRAKTLDPDFARTLKYANERLNIYDNAGYQQVLQDFITRKESTVKQSQNDIAEAAQLQAQNNLLNFKYEEALTQINKALIIKDQDPDYLALKARLLAELSRNNESIFTYKKALLLAKADTTKAVFYNNIGLVLADNARYDEAKEYFQKSLAIEKRVFGKDDRSATTYNNLGTIYNSTGYYDKALAYFDSASMIWKGLFGEQDETMATVYNNIGLVLAEKGEFDEALIYYNKALLVYEKDYTGELPKIATVYNNFGLAYDGKNDYPKAIYYYKKDLEIDIKIFGDEHPTVGITYNNIAVCYNETGQKPLALEYFTKAQAIFEKVYDKDNPSLSNLYNNMGSVYDNLKEYDKALGYFFRSLEISLRMVGKNHPDNAITYNNIALVYREEKDYDHTLEYYQKGLDVLEVAPGKEHPRTQRQYLLVGIAYLLKGKRGQAGAYVDKTSLTTIKKANHLNSEGTLSFKSGRYQESIAIYLLAQDYMNRSDSARTSTLAAIICQNLAKAYCYKGEKGKASSLFEQALAMANKMKASIDVVERIQKNYAECK